MTLAPRKDVILAAMDVAPTRYAGRGCDHQELSLLNGSQLTDDHLFSHVWVKMVKLH